MSDGTSIDAKKPAEPKREPPKVEGAAGAAGRAEGGAPKAAEQQPKVEGAALEAKTALQQGAGERGAALLGKAAGDSALKPPADPKGEDKAPGSVTDDITGAAPAAAGARPSVDAAAAAFKERVETAGKAGDDRARLQALQDHRKDLESRPEAEARELSAKTADSVVEAAAPLLKGGNGTTQAALNALSGIGERSSGATVDKIANGVAERAGGLDNFAGPQLFNSIRGGHGSAFGTALAHATGSRNIANNVARAQEAPATAGEAARTVAEVAPVTGTALSAVDAVTALKNGDLKGAAIAALGAIPGAKLVGKGAKAAKVAARALDALAPGARTLTAADKIGDLKKLSKAERRVLDKNPIDNAKAFETDFRSQGVHVKPAGAGDKGPHIQLKSSKDGVLEVTSRDGATADQIKAASLKIQGDPKFREKLIAETENVLRNHAANVRDQARIDEARRVLDVLRRMNAS